MSVAIATHRTPPRRLLQAEFLKVRSTRVIWALLGGTLALALLALVGVLAGDQDGLPAWNTAEGTRRIFVSAGALLLPTTAAVSPPSPRGRLPTSLPTRNPIASLVSSGPSSRSGTWRTVTEKGHIDGLLHR